MSDTPLVVRRRSALAAAGWAIGLCLLLAYPFIISQEKYPIHVAITVFFNVSLATSMWLIWSLGFVSFAHAGFMGIGAYTSALFLIRLGLPLWVGMWAGAIDSFLTTLATSELAYIFGFITIFVILVFKPSGLFGQEWD